MQGTQIVFTAPGKIEVQPFSFDAGGLAPTEIAIQTTYSLISPGTELACLAGTESWAQPPFVPGYGACGTVTAVGEAVSSCEPGDTVFTYTPHASRVRTSQVVARVPAGLDPKLAPFTRMASIASTAVWASEAELGDRVLVQGLGLVGNLAAQLFTLSGCEVIGVDLSRRRRELAAQCGVRHVLDAASGDLEASVRDITGGRMCEVVVEATGVPALSEQAARVAGKLGEVILLGSPRGEHLADVTELLNRIHLWGNGCVTFKGAHEWRYPIHPDPGGYMKHSLQRNAEMVLGLMAAGRLHVEPLLTHVVPPEGCESAYAGLRDNKDAYLGVVIDWAAA